MQVIGIVLNVFFILILLLIMGFGFLFGMWRKLRSLGGLLIGIILLVILLNPIAKGIAKANLPFLEGTISDYVVEMISSEMENPDAIKTDGELDLLCESVALSISKMIVLFVGMLVVFAVIVPLNLLILRIVLGKDEQPKPLWVRFAGMGIGAVEVLIAFSLVTLPIYGTTSLIMSYEDVLKESEETAAIIETVEVIDNTIPNKINKIFGKKAPVNALGAFTKAKNKNGTINIFKELYNAKPVVKVIIESDSKYEGDFLQAAIANKEELIDFIKSTNILETFMPAVLEVLEASDSLEGIDIEELKKIDFVEDKVYLADMLIVLFDFIEESEIDFENPKAILANPNLPNALKGFGNALKDTTFADLLIGILQNVLDESLSSVEGLETVTSVLDLAKIEKQNLGDDLYQIGVIANSIYNIGLLEGDTDLLSKPEELKKLINAVLDFSLVKGKESEIIETLLVKSGLKENLSELGIEINYETANWNQEKVLLGNVIDSISEANKNIKDFDLSKVDLYLKNKEERVYVVNIINNLTKSTLINDDFILDILVNILKETSLSLDISNFDSSKVISWETEIDAIIKLLDIVGEGSFDITSMNKGELEKLVLIASGTAENPCYVTSYILGTIVNKSLKEFLTENAYQEFSKEHDLTDPNILRKSVNDIVTVITLSNSLNEDKGVEEWTNEQIIDFCETVASLDIKNGEVTIAVLYDVLNQTGAEITKEEIMNADLEKESAYLEEILTAIQNKENESIIEELIQKAEEDDAIIVSAVLDKIHKK